jgi:four helix bundle protein
VDRKKKEKDKNMEKGVQSYRDLIVWQKAVRFSVLIYSITDHFPKQEVFGLTSQLRRASISVASNIAEGQKRGTKKDFRHFLHMAYGSGAEIETQLEIGRQIGVLTEENHRKTTDLLVEIMKMLHTLIKKLG